jgi:hypothetical protein
MESDGLPAKDSGKYTEEMFFEGDQHPLNPMRYLPTPFHTKFAQERTALSQYIQQESVGTRMRRWERPIHDFLAPYFRGTVERLTGQNIIPAEVEHRRDLDTMADMMTYLRALNQATRLGPFPPATHKTRARGREGLRGCPQRRAWPGSDDSSWIA